MQYSFLIILFVLSILTLFFFILFMIYRYKLLQMKKYLNVTECRALEAQINPHFLYNALDSIMWMCESNRTQDAVRMTSALAGLFRQSVGFDRKLITIEEELQHAKNYLLIQQYRFHHQIEVLISVSPQCLQYHCNKIILQPLLENAIYHGIGSRGEGTIEITIQEIDTDLLILVSDNGIGMEKEEADNLLAEDKKPGGIGLRNVNRRLRLTYGERYGMTIISAPEEGTTVQILIPKDSTTV